MAAVKKNPTQAPRVMLVISDSSNDGHYCLVFSDKSKAVEHALAALTEDDPYYLSQYNIDVSVLDRIEVTFYTIIDEEAFGVQNAGVQLVPKEK